METSPQVRVLFCGAVSSCGRLAVARPAARARPVSGDIRCMRPGSWIALARRRQPTAGEVGLARSARGTARAGTPAGVPVSRLSREDREDAGLVATVPAGGADPGVVLRDILRGAARRSCHDNEAGEDDPGGPGASRDPTSCEDRRWCYPTDPGDQRHPKRARPVTDDGAYHRLRPDGPASRPHSRHRDATEGWRAGRNSPFRRGSLVIP